MNYLFLDLRELLQNVIVSEGTFFSNLFKSADPLPLSVDSHPVECLFQRFNSFLLIIEILIEMLFLHSHHLRSLVGHGVEHLDQLARHILSFQVEITA
jgi:hypothetical protein